MLDLGTLELQWALEPRLFQQLQGIMGPKENMTGLRSAVGFRSPPAIPTIALIGHAKDIGRDSK